MKVIKIFDVKFWLRKISASMEGILIKQVPINRDLLFLA